MTTEERIKIIESTNSFAEIPLDVLPPSHKENYYFVSYSHKDYKTVFPDILRLEELGVNIWYDNEMHIGENWREIAQLYISKFQCAGVIFYLTENSISSPACNQEVEYVLTHNKSFLSINKPLSGCGVQSGYAMLKELKKRGLQCEPSLLDNFERAFSDEILYLGIDEKIERKAKQICSIPKEDLLQLEKQKGWYSKEEELAVVACRDNTLIQLDLSKIQEVDGFSGNIAAIGDCVFTNSIKLQNVCFSDRLHKIGESAFRNCDSLEALDFSALRDVEIGKSAFKNCSKLKSVDLSHAKKIEEEAFSGCGQLTVDKLSGSIGRSAFCGTAIENVEYVAESPLLEKHAFWGTTSLRAFRIHGTFTDDLGDSAFYHCENLREVGPFVAPWTLYGENEKMLKMGAYAFNGCYALEKIRFVGAWDTAQANGAFWSCRSLRELDLDIKGTVIPDCFARDCKSLERVTHSERFTKIGEESFENCETLTEFDLSNVELVGEGAFAAAGLERAYLKNVRKIGASAFANCKDLHSVTIGASCTHVGAYAFLGCPSLQTVKILAENVEFKEEVFAHSDIGCLYLHSKNVFDALTDGSEKKVVGVLYVADGLDVSDWDLSNYDRKDSDENGYCKYVAGGKGGFVGANFRLDLTDSELNECNPLFPKYVLTNKRNANLWLGKHVTVKHRRLNKPYNYFVEEFVLTDEKTVDYITVSLHSGKSFRLDGTLIEHMKEAENLVVGGQSLRLEDPQALVNKDCCIVGNGEYHYAQVLHVRHNPFWVSDEQNRKWYLIETVLYAEDGKMKAISGLDIESVTVFNSNFEAEATYTRLA